MQKSFLVRQSVDFGQVSKFLIRPGDIIVFDSQNQNKVIVYRNGEIQKVLANQSASGLAGLAKSGWIVEIHANDAPKPGVAASKTAPKGAGKPAGSPSRAGNGQGATTASQVPQGAKKRIADSTI